MTKAAQPRLRRQHIIRVIQGVVSIGLLAWLALTLDWHQLTTIWTGIDPVWVIVSILLYYINLGISCYKWHLTLATERLAAPFGRLLRWYMIGAFANNFLPTDIGGDLGRGVYAARTLGNPKGVARSIIIERMTGLIAMAALAWLCLGFILGQWWLASMIAGGVIIGLLVLPQIERLIKRLPPRFNQTYDLVRETVARYREQPRVLLQLFSASFLSQILSGIGVWLNMQAVHANLLPIRVVLGSALAGVITTLPISINGWGVRESLYVYLLADQANNASVVLAGALFGRFLATLLTLVGAVALIFEPPTHAE